MAVVDAIADAEGIDPDEVSTPLGTVIDPDALDSLFLDETGRVSFDYHGYRVTVDYEGIVEVIPANEPADPTEGSSPTD